MGVRGLTTFIARNSDKYLETYYLHDTYLVIDGNNLAVQLYKWHAKCYDCFGGDYDVYKKAIVDFFAELSKCKITPLIVFDGCYEDKKLRTIYSRVKNRVKTAQRLNAQTEGSVSVFPLFLRELFTETIMQIGCKAVRCEFEADYEMACIARMLNCPVLSYDSDFYIFDVLYVPFTTISVQSRRIKKGNGSFYAIECKIYRIEKFLNSLGGMGKENLPLLAILLGNDYIKKNVFNNFYSQLKLIKRKTLQNDLQRKVETVIRWLQKETYESAARKILGRIKQVNRKRVAEQIKEITDGYICSDSTLLSYFDIKPPNESQLKTLSAEIDLNDIPDDPELENEDDDNASVTSDASLDVDETPSMEVQDGLSNHFPSWFLHEYRRCNFPAWYLDIAVHNRYFFIPQLENGEDEHSHHISVPLLAGLHKILTSGTKPDLIYIARKEKFDIKNFTLETSTLNLPTLEEVINIGSEQRKKILYDILNLDEDEVNLDKFPDEWRIFILSIVYWCKHFKVSNKQVHALILSAVTLNIVDRKVGYIRTLRQLNRFELAIESETSNAKKECASFLKEMIPNFYMDEKVCRNPRLYNIHHIDPFSRFQSCLYHIKYINKVLNAPYPDFLIADFYNGTFIYNLHANLYKRSDSLGYLNTILKNAGDILKQFNDIITRLVPIIDMDYVGGEVRRRKRKNRNKSREETDEADKKVPCVEDVDTSEFIDANNGYSILNCLNN